VKDAADDWLRFGSKISSGYLAYSFGLAPLLADMKKVEKACGGILTSLRRRQTRAGLIDTVTSTHRGSLTLGDSSGLLVVGGHTYFNTELEQVTTQPIRIVGIKGKRVQQYNSSVLADLDGLLTRFGGKGPASFVWEKIPYSFVVDWFVDLRGICNSLDNLLTGSRKEIVDAWSSVKYMGTLTSRFNNPNAITPMNNTMAFRTTLSRYTREPYDAPFQVRDSARFGKKQLSLSAALLYQKIAKR
jgi:hypothetical protein